MSSSVYNLDGDPRIYTYDLLVLLYLMRYTLAKLTDLLCRFSLAVQAENHNMSYADMNEEDQRGRIKCS
jgi:hypothetical protein